MITGRPSVAGRTRVCPHCKATILESATVCPACQHHLQFNPTAQRRTVPSFTALRVEGTVRHPVQEDAWEYSIVISIRNERGEEIKRQVVAVGALDAAEQRTVTLGVDVFKPGESTK